MFPLGTAFASGLALVLTSPAPGVAQPDPGTTRPRRSPRWTSRRSPALLALACLLVGTGSLGAQDAPPDGSPDEVARAFFAALDEERWSDAAEFYDPDSLQSWRRRVVREMELSLERFEEMVRRSSPALSDTAADSAASTMEEQLELGRRRTLSNRFAGIESLEALRGLDASDLAARALEAASPAYRTEQALDLMIDRRRTGGGNEVDDDERAQERTELEGGIPLERVRRIEGTVLSGDRAYVVYRIRFLSADDLDGPDIPALLPLIRADAGWRLVHGRENLLEEPGPFRVTRRPAPPD